MPKYLGLDLGTTTVTALVLDAESGRVCSVRTAANACETTSREDRRRNRSEWDAARMVAVARQEIGEAVAAGGQVEGIGVTGQMHGMLPVSADGTPAGPFIGWQDRRGLETMPGTDATYVDWMRARAEELGALERGCRPTSGYLGTALFWLSKQGALPGAFHTASFLPDYVVAALTGTRPVTDATDAAGSGLFGAVSRRWDTALIEALGLSTGMLPEVRPSASRAGGLVGAAAMGLPDGLPVYVACGDNQASFAGSVGAYPESLLVNVGTGGQVSAYADRAVRAEGLEARPYVDGRFLAVGAGLVGGRSYAWLRDVFREVGRAFFGGQGDEDLYEAMNRLAAAVPEGSEGLRCEPLFTGTRREPNRRGVWSGVGTENFTPGHMARAVLEGIAAQFRLLYGEMEREGAGGRTRLVGAGNGIRKNALLRDILSGAFGMDMVVPEHAEEAAFGAALLAGVGNGFWRDWPEAGRVIRYQQG